MKILIVEDESTSMELLESFLRPIGNVDLAKDGESAMKAINASFETGRRYDLICLDIMMPGMNGREVLAGLRLKEEAAGILLGDGPKVVMITSLGDSRNILGSFNQQCDGYVVKPIEKNKLMAELARVGVLKA